MNSPLHVERYGAGPALVLLHGGGPGCSSSGDFAAVIPELARHRTVWAVDLDQYGGSPTVRIDGPAAEHHASRVATTLDELDVTGADLVCQSLGGLVAFELTATRPELVRRLVVTGSQPIPGEPATSDWTVGPELRRRVFADGVIDAERIHELQAASEWWNASAIPDELTRRRLHLTRRHHERVSGTDAAARGSWKDMTASLPSVTAPVLLVWGRNDPFARPEYALAVAELLPNATVHVIPQARHHVQSEHPRAYTRAVLPFLLDPTFASLPSKPSPQKLENV